MIIIYISLKDLIISKDIFRVEKEFDYIHLMKNRTLYMHILESLF